MSSTTNPGGWNMRAGDLLTVNGKKGIAIENAQHSNGFGLYVVAIIDGNKRAQRLLASEVKFSPKRK